MFSLKLWACALPVLICAYILVPNVVLADSGDWDDLEATIENEVASTSAQSDLLDAFDDIQTAISGGCEGYQQAVIDFAQALMDVSADITDAEFLAVDAAFATAVNAETTCSGGVADPVVLLNDLKCLSTGRCYSEWPKSCYQGHISGPPGEEGTYYCRQKVSD